MKIVRLGLVIQRISYSLGFRSGLWFGHSRIQTSFLCIPCPLSHFSVEKLFFYSKNTTLADWHLFSSKICLYLASSVMPLMATTIEWHCLASHSIWTFVWVDAFCNFKSENEAVSKINTVCAFNVLLSVFQLTEHWKYDFSHAVKIIYDITLPHFHLWKIKCGVYFE